MRINKPAFHVTLVLFGFVGSLIAAPQLTPKPVTTAAMAPLRPVQAPTAPDAAQARREALERCQMLLVLQADAGCAGLLVTVRQQQAAEAEEGRQRTLQQLCRAFPPKPGQQPEPECREEP